MYLLMNTKDSIIWDHYKNRKTMLQNNYVMEDIIDKVSPMMQHYIQTKLENKDCILFYRLGDFCEMFFDDAITVSRELELT